MKEIKADVVTNENKISGRQGWAYVCNSGAIKVLKADLDKPQEYETYKKFGKVNASFQYKGKDRCLLGCTLVQNEGKWQLANGGCFLSNRFSYDDAMELIDNNNAPTITVNGIVAIAQYTDTTVWLELFKVGKIDEFCTIATTLTPLNDEEMAQIKADVITWLNRY